MVFRAGSGEVNSPSWYWKTPYKEIADENFIKSILAD